MKTISAAFYCLLATIFLTPDIYGVEYNMAPRTILKKDIKVFGAPTISRAIVSPFPHLKVRIIKRTATTVTLKITTKSNVIPGTIYNISLVKPGPNHQLQVLVTNKGSINLGTVDLRTGQIKTITIRGSKFGKKVKIKLDTYRNQCGWLKHGDGVSLDEFGVYDTSRNGTQVSLRVSNPDNASLANNGRASNCKVIMSDYRNTQQVTGAFFTGSFIIKRVP